MKTKLIRITTSQPFLTLLLLATALASHAQSWTNRYNGNASDNAHAIAVDGNDNVIVTGSSINVNGGVWDFLTIKYSNAGVPLWTNRYNGSENSYDEAYAVAVDGSGNVFVTGYTYSDSGGVDSATIKYSSAGLPLWTNRYDGASHREDLTAAMAVDHNGDVIVAGHANLVPFPGLYSDYLTIKYSNAGVPLWTRLYSGGFGLARAVAVDGSGNVFVTGNSQGDDGNPGFTTIAYSNAGAPLWTNRYDGGYRPYAIAADSDGNVFVTGGSSATAPGPGFADFATIAYSNTGAPLWTNRYDSPSDGHIPAYAIAADSNGNVFVAGGSATIAYSNAGAPLWTNRYDRGNEGIGSTRMAVDGSGNVFVTMGYALSTNIDFVTIKYSGAGMPLWTNRYGGPGHGDDYSSAIAVDSRGNAFVTGTSWNGADYDFVTIKYAATGPLLNFSRTGPNTLNISWPSSSSVSNLQQRTSLTGGVWTTPPEPVTDNGTTKSIAVDTSSGSRFFRLAE